MDITAHEIFFFNNEIFPDYGIRTYVRYFAYYLLLVLHLEILLQLLLTVHNGIHINIENQAYLIYKLIHMYHSAYLIFPVSYANPKHCMYSISQ